MIKNEWGEVHTYLTWYSSSLKDGTFFKGNTAKGRLRMNIDGIKPFMPLEELLPKRRQGQAPSRQEHERDFPRMSERHILHLRNHRRSPQQLLVAHAMHARRRLYELLQARLPALFRDLQPVLRRRRRPFLRRRRRRRRRRQQQQRGGLRQIRQRRRVDGKKLEL